MDFHITRLFRSIVNDIQLIADVIHITPQFRPAGKAWLEAFTEGLAAVVEREADEIVPVLQYPETLVAPRIEYAHNNSASNQLLREMAWEFFHSLVLQFLAEELSQYPFWAAKVALATADTSTLAVSPLGPFAALWGLLSARFQAGGLLALYHGCVPYAVAAYMYHIDHVEVLMRRYLHVVVSRLPRSPSAVARYNQQQSLMAAKASMLPPPPRPPGGHEYSAAILTADPAAHPATAARHGAPGANQHHHQSSSSSASSQHPSYAMLYSYFDPSEPSHEFPSSNGNGNGNGSGKNGGKSASGGSRGAAGGLYFHSLGIFGRVFRMALAHPFLVLPIKMVTDPALKQSNWATAYIRLLAKGGLGSLYAGVRASLLFAVMPFSHSWLLGCAETIVYRCVLGQGGGAWDREQLGVFSLLTSVVAAHHVLQHEGLAGMFRYGALTAAQLAPGFAAFVGARLLLKLTCGSTLQRRREAQRRREILEEYWLRYGYQRQLSAFSIPSLSNISSSVHDKSPGRSLPAAYKASFAHVPPQYPNPPQRAPGAGKSSHRAGHTRGNQNRATGARGDVHGDPRDGPSPLSTASNAGWLSVDSTQYHRTTGGDDDDDVDDEEEGDEGGGDGESEGTSRQSTDDDVGTVARAAEAAIAAWRGRAAPAGGDNRPRAQAKEIRPPPQVPPQPAPPGLQMGGPLPS